MTGTATTGQQSAPVRSVDAEAAGRRVEEILDRLEADGGAGARAAGNELVRALMQFYGAGLARVLELLGVRGGGAGAVVRGASAELGTAGTTGAGAALLGDSQVAALLTLHDLHPEDLRTRVERALASVPNRPFELAAVDEVAGSVTVKQAESTGCGCPSTVESGRSALEDALACFAPEIADVEVAAAEPARPLLQIGTRPGAVSGATR